MRHCQGIVGRKSNPDLVCRADNGRVTNRNLCVFPDYNKFDLPVQEGVNMIDIGIDITDVLRINDKVGICRTANFAVCAVAILPIYSFHIPLGSMVIYHKKIRMFFLFLAYLDLDYIKRF